MRLMPPTSSRFTAYIFSFTTRSALFLFLALFSYSSLRLPLNFSRAEQSFLDFSASVA